MVAGETPRPLRRASARDATGSPVSMYSRMSVASNRRERSVSSREPIATQIIRPTVSRLYRGIMLRMNQEVFAALAEALQQGEEVALVTITSSTGSTPQRVGAKMLVYADGRTVGTIGGGCYENDAFWKAREAITARQPRQVKIGRASGRE